MSANSELVNSDSSKSWRLELLIVFELNVFVSLHFLGSCPFSPFLFSPENLLRVALGNNRIFLAMLPKVAAWDLLLNKHLFVREAIPRFPFSQFKHVHLTLRFAFKLLFFNPVVILFESTFVSFTDGFLPLHLGSSFWECIRIFSVTV